ncbi:MAG: GAF domain-containing protein [Calditrichaceae bacterium]|nr:GAF domain-containing protein [Calditrichaceae bacterium]MBN2708309.1 GAF domain-containing protein [Calditrichaceae bacterium]RQV97236.1 MAG: GAF domain-containing protein [Calditrichota bacterium]
MSKFISLYILAILGIFIDLGSWWTIGNIIFKIVIFGGISYLMFMVWKDMEAEDQIEGETVSSSSSEETIKRSVFENKFDLAESHVKNNPDINDFLKRQFKTIWNYIMPDRGFLFFEGLQNEPQLIYSEADAQLDEISAEKLKSFLSVIDKTKGVLIENNIQPAQNVIPFSAGDIYMPKSLLAFTTDISQGKKFYWIFDAGAANHFNKDDTSSLELINLNNLKTLELIAEANGIGENLIFTNKMLELSNKLNSAKDYERCQEVFTETIIESFEASKFTIALKHDEKTAIIKKSIGIDDSFKYGFEFPLDDGLNGWVIRKNKPYLIENIDKGDYFIPRFTRDEKTNYGLRCFLSVPIIGKDEAVGMITLEHKEINKYSVSDKEKLTKYTEIFSNAIHKYLEHDKN